MTIEPLPMDQDPLRALTEVIEAHDLYLHRHGTVPASKATAHSILHALRNRGLVLSLDAAHAQGRAEALDVEQVRADLRTLRRSLPTIVGPETAELWLAFGRVERALGEGLYAAIKGKP